MVIDARGHDVPSGDSAWSYRQQIEVLSKSISSVRRVLDEPTARGLLETMDVAGIDPNGTAWFFESADAMFVYKASSDSFARLHDETDYDSGWVDLTWGAQFRDFGGADTSPRIRRVGVDVELVGAASPNTAGILDGASGVAVFSTAIPAQFRPSGYQRVFVCQGSSDNRWALQIGTTGLVSARSYAPGSNATTSWLPIAVSWKVG